MKGEYIDNEARAANCFENADRVRRDSSLIAEHAESINKVCKETEIKFKSSDDIRSFGEKVGSLEVAEAVARIKLGKGEYERLMRE